MQTATWKILAIAMAVIAASARLSFAQNVADKPALNVGDLWVFHQTGTEAGKHVDRQWRRQIAETLADGMVRVTPIYNGVSVYDASWNPRHPETPDFWPADFEFPLRVGAEWSFASPVPSYDTTGRTYYQQGKHKVVAFEPITVPAGTFECFRLEGTSNWTSGVDIAHPNWRYMATWRMTRWYCPAVKYLAKTRIEFSASGIATGVIYSALDSELVRFVPRCETPRPGSRAGLPASRFDGDWTVVRACDAVEELPAFTDRQRAVIEGGQIVVEFGTPGRPGYACVAGRVAESGDLALHGSIISASQAYRGREVAASLEGRRDGDRFLLSGKFGSRKCSLTLTRSGAQ